jgi:hypothetical protein
MKSFERTGHILVLCASAAVLSACAAQAPTSSGIPLDNARAAMKSATSGQDLLYVSDPAGEDVYVYTYPQLKSVTTMTGFLEPYGLCSDAAGDVFISSRSGTSLSSTTIYEYAHGGTSPIATLNDPGIAFGCAVDPATGDLAVANRNDDSNPNDAGDVAVYSASSGTPTIYYSSDFSNFFFCGYDDQSNLFLSALNTSSRTGEFALVGLAKGSSSLQQISLNAKLAGYDVDFAPSVQWDGKHITVSSLNGSETLHRGRTKILVYRLSITGVTAKVIGATTLKTASRNLHFGQSWIQATAVIAAYTLDGQRVGLWAYPRGGVPKQAIKVLARPSSPFWGVTVSAGSKL